MRKMCLAYWKMHFSSKKDYCLFDSTAKNVVVIASNIKNPFSFCYILRWTKFYCLKKLKSEPKRHTKNKCRNELQHLWNPYRYVCVQSPLQNKKAEMMNARNAHRAKFAKDYEKKILCSIPKYPSDGISIFSLRISHENLHESLFFIYAKIMISKVSKLVPTANFQAFWFVSKALEYSH